MRNSEQHRRLSRKELYAPLVMSALGEGTGVRGMAGFTFVRLMSRMRSHIQTPIGSGRNVSATAGWVVGNRGASTLGNDDSCHSTAASCGPVDI